MLPLNLHYKSQRGIYRTERGSAGCCHSTFAAYRTREGYSSIRRYSARFFNLAHLMQEFRHYQVLMFLTALLTVRRLGVLKSPVMYPEEFRDDHIPLGYLITIRAYGTWLHGAAGAVDRRHNRYGTPRLPADKKRQEYNERLLVAAPVTLGPEKRAAIELGIRETCDIRKWTLWALNARTNHVHSVVSANCKPKKIAIAFKANATRKMREAGVWQSE